jgi:hypothetical protein
MRCRERGVSRVAVAGLALVVVASAPPLCAQTCTVPGSHATIQEAIDDPACATITLSAQVYPESIVIRRSLTLAGPGSGGAVVRGLVLMTGPTTQVTLQDLRVENGCVPDAIRSSGGAKLTGNNLQVERMDGLPCPLTADTIFVNGFESGNTTAWSNTTPQPRELKVQGAGPEGPAYGSNTVDHASDDRRRALQGAHPRSSQKAPPFMPPGHLKTE